MTTTPYCTLAEAKAELVSDLSVDDVKLMAKIRQVSARIDRKFWAFAMPFFAPSIATLDVPIDPSKIISWNRTLRLPLSLFSASSVTINGITVVIGTGVRLYPPLQTTPYFILQLINNNYSWYALASNCSGCGNWQQQFVTIAGVWGWNADTANMWLAVDTITTVGGINSSVTTFTVADVDGANPYGITPRISAGNLLQIDSEWMQVISTITGTNTVNVLRAQNGSTAASHAQGTSIQVYQVDENIRQATARQVGLQYAREGAFDARDTTGAGVIEFPRDVLDEFNGLLQLFANLG